MARLMRRGTFVGGAAAAGAAAAALPASAATTQDYGPPLGGTAEIAVIGPFTGDAIRMGEQIADGVRAALDDANRIHGTLDRVFVLRTYDDQNALASGLLNAGFVCDDESLLCAIGHLSGRITEQCLQTYVNAHMPIIVPVSTYDRLTSHGYANVLRLPTKDSTEGNLAAGSAIAEVKPKSAVVYYQDGDYGIDTAAGFHDRLLREKIASRAVRFAWDKPDFATVAKVAIDEKADLVYLAGLVKDMGPLITQLRTAGYKGPLYASQGFFDALTLQKYKADAEGLTVSTSMPPLNLAPADYRIREDFQQKYGQFTPFSTFGYAAAQIAIAAVRRAGAADRIAVARALGIQTSFDTVVGTLQFGSTGDPIDPNIYFYGIKDGKWAYLRAAHPSSFILK
jgi:branched-chain amino acid transport system substrate-binding protein